MLHETLLSQKSLKIISEKSKNLEKIIKHEETLLPSQAIALVRYGIEQSKILSEGKREIISGILPDTEALEEIIKIIREVYEPVAPAKIMEIVTEIESVVSPHILVSSPPKKYISKKVSGNPIIFYITEWRHVIESGIMIRCKHVRDYDKKLYNGICNAFKPQNNHKDLDEAGIFADKYNEISEIIDSKSIKKFTQMSDLLTPTKGLSMIESIF